MRKTDSLPAAKSAEFLFHPAPPEAAFALLRNMRKTDSRRRPEFACSSSIWRRAFAVFALLRNSRKVDSLPAAESAEFLFRLVPPEAAFALLSKTPAKRSLDRGLARAYAWRTLRAAISPLRVSKAAGRGAALLFHLSALLCSLMK